MRDAIIPAPVLVGICEDAEDVLGPGVWPLILICLSDEPALALARRFLADTAASGIRSVAGLRRLSRSEWLVTAYAVVPHPNTVFDVLLVGGQNVISGSGLVERFVRERSRRGGRYCLTFGNMPQEDGTASIAVETWSRVATDLFGADVDDRVIEAVDRIRTN